MKNDQEQDGSWYGRWGVNYIYGTWSVLSACAPSANLSRRLFGGRSTGSSRSRTLTVDGGESCLSYADVEESGRGEVLHHKPPGRCWLSWQVASTDSFSLVGIHYLIRNQRKDGSWEEVRHTGTGFPRVFYLRYHWYCQYFPSGHWLCTQPRTHCGTTRADELRQHNLSIRTIPVAPLTVGVHRSTSSCHRPREQL